MQPFTDELAKSPPPTPPLLGAFWELRWSPFDHRHFFLTPDFQDAPPPFFPFSPLVPPTLITWSPTTLVVLLFWFPGRVSGSSFEWLWFPFIFQILKLPSFSFDGSFPRDAVTFF